MTKDARLAFRWHEDTKEGLERAARKEGRSLSDMAERIVATHLRRAGLLGGKRGATPRAGTTRGTTKGGS